LNCPEKEERATAAEMSLLFFVPDGIGRNGQNRKKKIPKEFHLQTEKFAYIIFFNYLCRRFSQD